MTRGLSTGRFVSVKVRYRSYWYFDQPDCKGGQTRRYVEPSEDPEIIKRVEDFARVKTDYRIRRRLVASLTRDGGLVRLKRCLEVLLKRSLSAVCSGCERSSWVL